MCILEKGNKIGDDVISGDCFETKAFDELFPLWRTFSQEKRPPIDTPVIEESFYLLGEEKISC